MATKIIKTTSRTQTIFVPPQNFLRFYIDSIEDASKKFAFLIQEDDFDRANVILHLNPQKLKEKLISTTTGIATVRDSFMYPLMEEVVQRLYSAGIPQQREKLHIFFNVRREVQPEKEIPLGLKSFSTEDLSYGFEIWLIASGISVLVFMAEIGWKLCFYLWVEFKEYVGLAFVVNFLRTYTRKAH